MAYLDQLGQELPPEEWLALNQIGTPMYRPPEQMPELSRGLPDYEQRSPAELAQMRTRMGVIPQQGRPDITPEHMAQMVVAGAGAVAAPETMAIRGLAALPRAAAVPLTALGSYLYGTEQAGGEEKKTPKDIMAEQRILQANGFYKGKIDGNEGEQTIAARELARQAKEKSDADAEQRNIELEKLKAGGVTAGNESARLALEKEKLDAQTAGSERLKQVDAAVPPWRKALREYGPPLGYVAGGVIGLGTSAAVRGRANSLSEARAAKAESMFDKDLGTKQAATSDRVGRLQDFWNLGGGAGREPFINMPGSAPGFAANPKASAASSLYQPERNWNVIPNIGANALAGAEMTYAHVQGAGARDELGKAREAINEAPTESNIQRLQTAQDNAAWYDFLENAGRGAAIIHNGKVLLKPSTNVKPSIAAAEAERLDIEKIMRAPPSAPRSRKAAVPAASEPPLPASEQARREQRRFTDQGESLADILKPVARDPRFMKPDM